MTIPRPLEMEINALASMPAERRQEIRAGLAFDRPAAPSYARDVRAAKRSRANGPRASLSVALSPMVAGPRRCEVAQYLGGWAVLPSVFRNRVASLSRADVGVGKAVRSVDVQLISVDDASIAVVPVHGLLSRWGTPTDQSGSSAILADIVRSLASDKSIPAILLHVDSPGGSSSGIADLSDAVFEARQIKPVVAVVDELGASGAYWVASQSSAIFASNVMSRVGSVGAFNVVMDYTEALKARGIQINVFRSGPLKGAGIDGLSDPQREMIQRQADETARVFKDAIKRGRGIGGKLLESLATGEVYSPTFAKSAGLIDGILSFNEVVWTLARSVKGVTR